MVFDGIAFDWPSKAQKRRLTVVKVLDFVVVLCVSLDRVETLSFENWGPSRLSTDD